MAWLHTNSRWIVGEDNVRVKLTCVNWPSHLDTMVPEGLNKQPVEGIVQRISSMGFNCVRLTWALYMATDESYSTNMTVQQMFHNLNLNDVLVGIAQKNPDILDLVIVDAFKHVLDWLGKYKVMVIVDNHISKPGWCCNEKDGNGFFNDPDFDPDVWIRGLAQMAIWVKDLPYVVGMSLRNELRGPRENVDDWFRYMERGASAVNAINPNVLVILSGLNFDNDLSFLRDKKPVIEFQGKLVFELHWYSWTDNSIWSHNSNKACNIALRARYNGGGGFLVDQGFPLFISEFGVDQTGSNTGDNKYLICFSSVAALFDWDWALWTLGGSYYVREGVLDHDETYAILDANWDQPRNPRFKNIISGLQYVFGGPGGGPTYYWVIFHPSTSLCVIEQTETEPLKLGPCDKSQAWDYTTAEKILRLSGKSLCLQADGLGKPVKLGRNCDDPSSKWQMISDSYLHLSTDGTSCLDIDSSNTIVTNPCKCLSDDNCDPFDQWFRIVQSSRSYDDHLPHRNQTLT
ncbi:hypothetical protein NE237_008337 [Protea cynaroides]|uniref:Ricin B lectin domain-containing protein n=1 Tax=Protea cynaroides TaxID=273540 RepID=A0A9Q0KVF0_9MAGN|nr:hypothetical protein NE237_008337 [Protea cynaroides]